MRIDYREQGGIAGFARQYAVADGRITYRFRRAPVSERELAAPEQAELERLVQALHQANPKASYGGTSMASCIMSCALDVDYDGKALSVRAVTDPNDRPPSAFWNLVRRVQEYGAPRPSS